MRKKKKSDKPCFQQKKVVIIGATGGLGMAYTEMFLREGAAVYLGCRSVDVISEQYGDNGQRIKIGYVDLQDPDVVEKFARQVQLEVGDVAYVINATGYDVRKGLLEHENEEIKHCIEVNLTGAIYLTKSFLLILINVVSWGMFFVGSMMGGKELVHMIWKRE